MECHVIKQAVPMHQVLFDSFIQQSLESDILLPDYCPDILRILKCDTDCTVISVQTEGKRLTVEAVIRIFVLYVGENRQLRRIEHKLPFTKACDLGENAENPVVQVRCKTERVSCRAISSRRLEVRGTAVVQLWALECSTAQTVCSCDEKGVQLKKATMESIPCVGQAASPFTVREELELGYGKPPVGCIIGCQMAAIPTDHKIISGKIVTKGELRLRLLYYPTEAEGTAQKPECMEYALPISQIIDYPAAEDENTLCSVQYRVTGSEVQAKPDMDGENRVISLLADIAAEVTVHRRQQIVFAQDCFCTDHECTFEKQDITFLHLLRTVQEPIIYKENVQLPTTVQEVLFGWSRVLEQNVQMRGGQLEFSIQLENNLLLQDKENALQSCTNVTQVTQQIAVPGEGSQPVFFWPQITPVSVSYNISGEDQVELRVELQIQGGVYSMMKKSGICTIELEEEVKKQPENACALTIYYADQGESVWDIAKRYNTAITGIMEENSIESDVLPKRSMLLIPML